ITSTIKSGGEVTITGFGTFSSKRREARMGVNPQKPQEKIQIPAVTVPKFKAGKTLKDALKN
ncbi:MAG TPA: HU family DNA-binding protein, partial [Patescibacteria group bacterium]|nr:HU family DNA-binding protein [Patescibacteria group bacterium]